jgi:hypothetical protein
LPQRSRPGHPVDVPLSFLTCRSLATTFCPYSTIRHLSARPTPACNPHGTRVRARPKEQSRCDPT